MNTGKIGVGMLLLTLPSSLIAQNERTIAKTNGHVPESIELVTPTDTAVYDTVLADLRHEVKIANIQQQWEAVLLQGEVPYLINKTESGSWESLFPKIKRAVPVELSSDFITRNRQSASLTPCKSSLKVRLLSNDGASTLFRRDTFQGIKDQLAALKAQSKPRSDFRFHERLGFTFTQPGYTKDKSMALMTVRIDDGGDCGCARPFCIYVLRKQANTWKIAWKDF